MPRPYRDGLDEGGLRRSVICEKYQPPRMKLIWLRRDEVVSIERDADPLLIAPRDMAGDAHAVCLKDQAEAVGDTYWACYVERSSPDRHVSDDTVDGIDTELDCSGHQNTIPQCRTPFHGSSIHQFPQQSVNADLISFRIAATVT